MNLVDRGVARGMPAVAIKRAREDELTGKMKSRAKIMSFGSATACTATMKQVVVQLFYCGIFAAVWTLSTIAHNKLFSM